MPPQVGDPDYCFVASGGVMTKVDPDGSASNWGIDAPLDGFTASTLANNLKLIDEFDTTAGWSVVNCVVVQENTIHQGTSPSMVMAVAASLTATATKTNVLNLATYGTDASPDEDFIATWVRVDNPANLDYLQIEFDLGSGNFSSALYQKQILASSEIPSSNELVQQTVGIADNPALGTTQGTWVVEQSSNESDGPRVYFVPFDNPQQLANVLNAAGQTTITTAIGTWVRLRMPKATFQRTGGGSQMWENVQAIRLTVKTNAQGSVLVYWDGMYLTGGAGLQGTYQYSVTFANSTTGSTSNPNPSEVTVENVQRQPVLLSALPLSTDPQVDQRWIFRTVGNGTLKFRVGVVDDNVTLTFTDRVADFFGLDSDTTLLMSNIQLQFDNNPPDEAWGDTWGPFAGRVWWARSSIAGERGRVFYSPQGRPEATEGFLDVTSDDDPTTKGLIWNGANYVFTENRIFQVVGPDVGPFTSREIFGAPGTVEAFSVIATPRGIAYLAHDGPRLFNGIQSTLISPDACVLLFRGETLEGITFGVGFPIIGGYTRDEYVLSDEITTVAVNVIDGTWRVLGVPMGSFFYEADTGASIANVFGRVVQFETEGQTLDGTDLTIQLDWQTPALETDEAQVGLIQRLYIEMDTDDQSIQVVLTIDDVDFSLPAFQTSGRATVEWAVGLTGRVASVRLSAFLLRRVTLYGIKIDVHVGTVVSGGPQ